MTRSRIGRIIYQPKRQTKVKIIRHARVGNCGARTHNTPHYDQTPVFFHFFLNFIMII